MPDLAFSVRRERSGDEAAIRRVHEAAFPTPAEADLVDRLRAARYPGTLSLVADDADGELVGHVLFTRITLHAATPDGPIENSEAMCGLGPIGVLPPRQREGIGSALIREGIAACEADGVVALVVLGDPAYYSRFGFVPAASLDVHWERMPNVDVFQALELRAEAFAGGGTIRYAPEFDGA